MGLADTLKDDYTKQWSFSRLGAFTILLMNLLYAGLAVYRNHPLPDLGTNWLAAVLALYGMNKTASVLKEIKHVDDGSVEVSK